MDLEKYASSRDPVKIVLERRVHPGSEEAFEVWVKRLIEAAGRSAALQGSTVLTAGGDLVDGQCATGARAKP